MTDINEPAMKPVRPYFSSGPCAKRPGWRAQNLNSAFLSRSHRASGGKAKLKQAIDETRALLNVPDDYHVGIVPASDTGAVEMALWSLLGARPVDMLTWESFGEGWVSDVVKQLKLDARILRADYGDLPDLAKVNFSNDVVFLWNGTTSGVCVPNGDWIPSTREGLVICDATSAVFGMDVTLDKLDVVTFSWQKALGGEGAHGVIILSPRAVQRLETYTPEWPIPKIFRMTKGGKLIEGIFKGATINTPSMLCVEDYLDALQWAREVGGLQGLIARAEQNFEILKVWIDAMPWITFLAKDLAVTSKTSVCLSVIDERFLELSSDRQEDFLKEMVTLLDNKDVAYDINSYRDAPAGLRIWTGATVDADDLAALMPWLEWAFKTTQQNFDFTGRQDNA